MASWTRHGVSFGFCVLMIGACSDGDDEPAATGGATGAGAAQASGGTAGKGGSGGASNGGKAAATGGSAGEVSSGGAASGGDSSRGAGANVSMAGGGSGGVVGAVECSAKSDIGMANEPCAVNGATCNFDTIWCCGVSHVFHFCRCEDHTWSCWSEDWCREDSSCGGAGGGDQSGVSETPNGGTSSH